MVIAVAHIHLRGPRHETRIVTHEGAENFPVRPSRPAQRQKKPLRLVELPQTAANRFFQQLLLDLFDAVADRFQHGENLVHRRIQKRVGKVVRLHASSIPAA